MKKILLAIAALAAGVQAFGSTAPAASINSNSASGSRRAVCPNIP